MGESFLDSYLKSSVQDDYEPSDPLFNNTRIDNGLMVPSTNEDPNRLFYTTSNTRGAKPTANKSAKPSSQSQMANIHLSDIRSKLQAKGFPKEVIKRMEETLNKSSNITVGSAINK
ncbi:hypothetical protein F8M41_013590 [Gigaspora margarita]|uniref:Uncharacterized protein n=1 Tax=Gigaspora margarita TaxID=4874 RepID=A0A8H4A0D4_GIGMA|nr:hypothetical protein F8M41_013590 [Gigaspora margarita]